MISCLSFELVFSWEGNQVIHSCFEHILLPSRGWGRVTVDNRDSMLPRTTPPSYAEGRISMFTSLKPREIAVSVVHLGEAGWNLLEKHSPHFL